MEKGKMKIVASLLVFALTFSYFSIIQNAIASSLEDQTSKTNQANVEFDTYFMENGQKVHSSIKTIGEENYIYATIAVKNAGYLKNAKLELDNPNFKIADNFSAKEVSKVESNAISFNKIKNGNTATVSIPVQMIVSENIDLTQFNKENTIKFTATYVDGNGNEKQVRKDITIQLAWTAEKLAELNVQILKFVQFSANNKQNVMLQTILQSYLKDNNLPVKENKIEITVPTIDNEKPSEVKVIANTTKETNGDETGTKFTSDNYTYDKETGKLTIIVNNEEQENKISWKKNAIDEFVVTYVYENKQITGTDLPITLKANSKLTIYEANQTNVTKEIEGQATLKNSVGDLTDFEVKTTEKLSKGQIYANYEAETKKETEYKEEIVTNVAITKVGETDVVNKITLELSADNFVTENNSKAPTTVSNNNYVYFKELKISKSNFDKILSEEGNIKIYNGTTLVATIDKNMQADTKQNYVVDLKDLNVNTLKIETSKPVVEGKLKLELTKAIKGEIAYSKDQAKTFTKIETTLTGTALKDTNKVTQKTVTKEIVLTEPTSQAELVMDNTNLSTVTTNKDVKITAILKTNTLDCNLYKNPTLKITLPKYIETINVKKVEVLFDTEGSKLTLKENKVVENADGTKTIEVTLEGMQTEYALAAVAKGVNVVITTDLTINKLTPSKQEQIKMVYTNASTQETNEVSTAVNFVAPTGVVTTTAISNYKENAETLTAISGEAKVATIETMAEARNTKFEMTVINNYNNTIDNISILGRIPAKGNKEVVTGSDLGSTIDMPLVSNIVVNSKDNNKVTIYYSENVNATKDLALSTNGWTSTPTDLSKVKSYLIVFTDYTMNIGDSINFSYEAQIPANLQHNASAYGNYGVYFNNNLEAGTIQDKASSVKVGVTTGSGPVIEATLTSNTEESKKLLANDIVIYKLEVKNIGTEDAQNVVASFIVPDYLTYVEESDGEYKIIAITGQEAKIDFGTIEKGKIITKEILMRVGYIYQIGEDNTIQSKKETETTFNITAENIAKTIEIGKVKNTIGISSYNTTSSIIGEIAELKEGSEFTYYAYISSANAIGKQDSNGKIKYNSCENTIVQIEIPKELEYEGIEIQQKEGKKEKTDITNITTSKYDKATGILTINLGDITENISKIINVKLKVSKLEENTYCKKININSNIYGKNTNVQTIKEQTIEIGKIGFRITQSANITENAYVTAYEDLEYVFTIENLSNLNLNSLKITDILPKELTLNSMKVIRENGKIQTIYNPTMKINIKAKETITLKVAVIANALEETTRVSNKLKLEYEGIDPIESAEFTHFIEKFDDSKIDDPGDNPNYLTKRIMGQVWEDENNNGIKEDNEKRMQDIEVLLFNNQTGTIVTDETGNILKAVTDKDGVYTFSKVAKGKYTAIFLYDTANYSATTYRKDGVDTSLNSDGIDSKITINGQTRIAAITEEIIVADNNIYNIDLGLISNPKFDLKLDKSVTRIIVQTGNKTDEYIYNDTKLAKKDLIGRDINNTSIIVEYKLKVTNEGAIAGYVKKIADYMPSEMKFNSELNSDWYTNGDGTLYNSSLANTLIRPGESKEVTLTLTKKMTENNLGLYNNTAEIYEAYNDLGLEDYDSTPGNKVNGEDDISSADVLITLKTGEVIIISAIAVIAITGVCIGAYFINKKVIK